MKNLKKYINYIKKFYNKLSKKTKIITLCVLVFIILFIVLSIILDNKFRVFSDKTTIEDPFKYINVSYSGNNGSGTAKLSKIENSEDNINFNIIQYKLSKASSLNEGEKITVEAKSEYYDLKITSKEYIVSGLYLYLDSFDNVNDEMKKNIIEKSEKYLNEQFAKLPNEAQMTNISHYKTYLVTDQKYSNYLYDIFIVTFKNKKGNEYTRYIPVVYENTCIVKGNNYINYSKMSIDGETIMYGQNDTYEEENYIMINKGFYEEKDIKLYFIKTYPKYKLYE